MISNYSQYREFLSKDKAALGIPNTIRFKIKDLFYPHYTWKFQKRMRKLEYCTNTSKSIADKIYVLYLTYSFRKFSKSLGFSIPINVFGPGLAIVHYGTIVIHPNTRVGKNCRIHTSVNIGASNGSDLAPQIGDNIYIAPGVKIYGDIKIANNIAIAPNSVVSKSIEVCDVLVAGAPAKIKRSINIKNIINI